MEKLFLGENRVFSRDLKRKGLVFRDGLSFYSKRFKGDVYGLKFVKISFL